MVDERKQCSSLESRRYRQNHKEELFQRFRKYFEQNKKKRNEKIECPLCKCLSCKVNKNSQKTPIKHRNHQIFLNREEYKRQFRNMTEEQIESHIGLEKVSNVIEGFDRDFGTHEIRKLVE